MPRKKNENHKLGELAATAICGNDILSSTLYVSGIAILFAGIYAPFIFLLIAGVLYLYRATYIEVVEALPLNGGAYNCLLNGTSKTIAAIAGVTTFLSYIATAVISAKTAIEYLHTVFPFSVMTFTVLLLCVFALLVISGLKESSRVAVSIFIFHIICLTLFLFCGFFYFLNGNSHLLQNISQTHALIPTNGGIFMAIFFAFSASLLGISGFESSADFVEQQKRRVFRKTLRNMLLSIVIFNPLISLVVLNTMDLSAVAKSNSFVLANAAHVLGGNILQYAIVLDAFLVLSGAVLAAYISVSGLLSRMSIDRCMPHFLSKKNEKGAYPLTVCLFFTLCCSILLLTQGKLLALAGVYTIAFLGVMTMFALGNLILKETRKELRRTYKAPVLYVVLAAAATIAGIIGNIQHDINNLVFFQLYFLPLFFIVFTLLYQHHIFAFLMHVFKEFPAVRKKLHRYYNEITDQRIVAFVHNNANIYKILHYIDVNETARNVILAHCACEDHEELGEGIRKINKIISHLQQSGAFTHFNIEVKFVEIPFGPEAIEKICRELDINPSKIFIGSIHNHHPYDYASLGGVRVIF